MERMIVTKQNRNLAIHIAGFLLCIVAIGLAASGSGLKSNITIAIAVVGLLGNAYGIWRPTTWFR